MKDYTKKLGKVIEINEAQIHDHLGDLVRCTDEETLNAVLDVEENSLCNAPPDTSDQRQEPMHERAIMNVICIPRLGKCG